MGFNNQMESKDRLVLKSAMLIYEGQNTIYASTHPVHLVKEKMMIGAGTPMNLLDLENVLVRMGKSMSEGFVSDKLIYSSPNVRFWWRKAGIGNMFIKNSEGEFALKVHHPSLVFTLCGNGLRVFAVKGDEKPTADTELFNAPYYNIDAFGRLCTGNVVLPDETGSTSFAAWEKMFFDSYFTHHSNDKLIRSKKSWVGFWVDQSKSGEVFPEDTLYESKAGSLKLLAEELRKQ
ncbi:MAG: PRTRC system protein B [Methylophilus sp.]|uniref:PRTRC system protein B n=1 Tax=Methylophilus sp. TaxID=29541 RepID=UPI003F9EF21A